jgi:hypothetical protein
VKGKAVYGISKVAVNQRTRHLAIQAMPNFRLDYIIFGGIEHNQSNEFKALLIHVDFLTTIQSVSCVP